MGEDQVTIQYPAAVRADWPGQMDFSATAVGAPWLNRRPSSIGEVLAHVPDFDSASLLEVIGNPENGGRLLEVGAGGGRRVPGFARAGWGITAIDADADALEVLQHRVDNDDQLIDLRGNIRIEATRVEDFDVSDQFDAVLSLDFAPSYAFNSPIEHLAALRRLCRPNGVIVTDWLNPFAFWPEPMVAMPFIHARVGPEIANLRIEYHQPTFLTDPPMLDLLATYHVYYADGYASAFHVVQHYFWRSPAEIRRALRDTGLRIVEGDLQAWEPAWRLVLAHADSAAPRARTEVAAHS